jgi:hypothetical protein
MTGQASIIKDPVLHWTAIAEHARRYHGASWATAEQACDAVTGAFDSILPKGCDYNYLDGCIHPDEDHPDAALPRWNDPELLGCMVAALATSPPACALEVIYDTQTIVGQPAPPPELPGP